MKLTWKFISSFWRSEEQEEFFTPQNVDAKFILRYNALMIGSLTLHNGIWHFRYENEFKHQEVVKPLPDFPNINQEYKSIPLHPFFAQRIPGKGQMKGSISQEKENVVVLLKRFGRRTIANPFTLESAQ
ncbi:MAG: hypothetical protein U0U46_00480 [Saprospiraceae bacterium]